MSVPIRITVGDVEVEAQLNDSDCAQQIAEALPVEASASTWGEEIYFSIDVDAPAEDMQSAVELGDLGYWPPGSAFCIFFGMTPMSTAEEIRPASPVMVIGRMEGDFDALKSVSAGETVRVERA